jgi:hypothetical protein
MFNGMSENSKLLMVHSRSLTDICHIYVQLGYRISTQAYNLAYGILYGR